MKGCLTKGDYSNNPKIPAIAIISIGLLSFKRRNKLNKKINIFVC